MAGITTIVGVRAHFFDGQECRKYLEAVRWPKGIRCLRRRHARLSNVDRLVDRKGPIVHRCLSTEHRFLHECLRCRYQFSGTTGTFLHRTDVSLRDWFIVLRQFQTSKQTVSPAWIAKNMGVTYRTAWRMGNCLRPRRNDKLLRQLAERIVEREPLANKPESKGSAGDTAFH
jgi:hypothetical protein